MTSALPTKSVVPQRGMVGASHMRPMSASGVTEASRPDTANASKFSDDEAPKTAVKVAVRVRPPLLATDPAYELVPARFRGSTCQVPNPATLTVKSPHGQKLFVFDRVFSDQEDQDGIWDYVSDSVSSFVQGYNVSLLAYGQSGAGKSYTMGTSSPGDLTDPTKQGIVPRAAHELFNALGGAPASKQANGSGIKPPKRYQSYSDSSDKNWQLKATYVEIYNEQLRDLLVPESTPHHERNTVTIREDTKGRILLTGLTQTPINSIDDLINALNFGSSIRQTDATAINSKSSRSHAVFSLNLVQKKNRNPSANDKKFSQNSDQMSGNENWVTIDSKLHFVDLAGSERLKNTGLTGERVKEGISINAGLASLGKVISQLSTKTGGSHVSYRDSRLTRLLQDSLGGNAITYMVACVNPVEFHINETLNTVQYAQRARNIQSRPQIQQRAEDGDKQLVIDRLRSEVAFLREQIRSGERSERRNNQSGSRDGQPSHRENELQNQLLDMQENYSALSQRHAKLISEIAKTSGEDTENTPALKGAVAAASLSRLNRSSNFAEAVEQVVIEYEKTIQSLESSLSNSRSSLATSENNLLEREAKIVYMDAVTQQLTNRVQKSMEREAKAEVYTQELESKIEGMGTGEERHTIIMKDLRTELARVRESEASAEEYISTLEERLAEAEQDTDIMQREIRRLEHVVERQRAVGKMDNLLTELDNIRQDDVVKADVQQGANDNHDSSDMFHDQLVATTSAQHPNGEMNPESAEEEWKTFGPMDGEDESVYDDPTGARAMARRSRALSHRSVDRQASQAQSKALADKLETVTIELFELRVDHEKTVDELYDVGKKYQIALSTLAELQDAVDEAKTRPTSFLAKDGLPDVLRDSTQFSSSRISDSVLGSHGESVTLVEGSDANTVSERDIESSLGHKEESLADHMRRLKRANAEKDINISELNENYSQLQDQHKTTLDYIEELKEELAKTHQQASKQHRSSVMDHQLRRPASISSMHPDKEPRCFVNLRNLAVEHFQGNVKAATAFETNVSAAAAEYKLHTERIQALEAEHTSTKKEMDVKNTMIAGLTRERSSKVTPMDMTMVAQLRGHLSQSQQLVKASQERTHGSESVLLSEIQVLKNALTKIKRRSVVPGDFPEGEAEVKEETVPAGDTESYQDKLDALEQQVGHWEESHQESFSAMKASQQYMLDTMAGLEGTLANTQHLHSEQAAAAALRSDIRNETNMNLEAEKEKHVAQVTALQREIDGYKTTAQTHADKLLHLENSYAQIMGEVEEDAKTRKLTESELKTHRDLVQNLERQIEQQKSLATFHQQGLTSLQESHAKELDDLRSTLTKQQAESDRKLTEQLSKHQDSTSALQEELTKAHMELAEVMQGVAVALDKDASAENLPSHVRSLAEERAALVSKHKAASEALEGAQTEMQSAKQITIDLERKVKELTALNEETLGQLEKSATNEKKLSTRLNEAEVQLNSTADQQKASSQRLMKERAELEREVDIMKNKVSQLEGQVTEMKRMTHHSMASTPGSPDLNRNASNASTLRKSNSQQNLPSPPPAMPLPPLPIDAAKAPPSPALDGSFSRPHSSKGLASNAFSSQAAPPAVDPALAAKVEETESRLKTVEKHLFAEKQLTSTLEEALVDLETQANKTKAEVEAWKKKCREVEEEATGLRRERGSMRNSLQQIEEEKEKRRDAERARRQLEERMELMAKKGAKKKGNLNCF